MTAGKRLALFGAALAGLTAGIAYLSASSSWRYYATVDECLPNLGSFASQRIRVSGKVAVGTLQIAKDRKRATFSLHGSAGDLPVVCDGLVPDNLTEDREVVVEGSLDSSGVLQGDKVLTQCASKYEPDSNKELEKNKHPF